MTARRISRTTSEGVGGFQAPEEAQPACPICKGSGWVRLDVPVGHPQFGEVIPCRCRQQEAQAQRLERLKRYSNLGPLSRVSFETTDPEGRLPDAESKGLFREALDAARAFAENPQGWLVFTGPSGCGKTHLAAAIANRCIEKGYPVFFIFIPDLLDHLRATFAPESPVSYDELFEQVRSAPVLILDDLGAHSSTPWAQEKLFQVFNHRYNAQLPTVVTVRGPIERLEEGIRMRLQSRDLSRVLPLGRHAAPLLQMIGEFENLLKEMTFETFDVRGNNADAAQRATLEAAVRGARNYARDPQGWLLLTGASGCGKTHLAVAIANHRLKQGLPVFFAFVPALLDHLRYTFSPESRITFDELFEQVKAAPFLILDDLGSESSTPWAEDKLYQIIVQRHNARLPTVITTSRRLEELRPAIASRLKDPRVVQELPIYAPDYRDQERPRPTPRARRGLR